MTTMTSPSPAPPVAVSRVRHGELVGLWVLLRLNLRRERISFADVDHRGECGCGVLGTHDT